jgi:hypothetical protein
LVDSSPRCLLDWSLFAFGAVTGAPSRDLLLLSAPDVLSVACLSVCFDDDDDEELVVAAAGADDADDFTLPLGLFEGDVVVFFVDDPAAVRGLALVDAFSLPRLSRDDEELAGLTALSLGLS